MAGDGRAPGGLSARGGHGRRPNYPERMSDDPIRELLAAIDPQPFWGPAGQTAILEDKVIERGGDPAAVEQWVEAHGGRLDRTVPLLHSRVISREPVPDVQRFYLIPREALA